MIHVDAQPEPADFNELVRVPGQSFLALNPQPTKKQWDTHSYWRSILTELRHIYGSICAYSCHWIPADTGARTVEHFVPKHESPGQAYEWNNYRLVCSVLNSRKRTHTDTLDPFNVVNGWFILDFPSLLVKASAGLDPQRTQQVRQTIKRLKLNDEETCLENRARYIKDYCIGGIPFSHLRKEAPFIAMELERQGLVDEIKQIMIYDP